MIVANFSASQTPGVPGTILLTDTSTGTDVAVTQRRVYIQTAAGDYLVEEGVTTEYSPWLDFPSTTELTLTDILTKIMVFVWLCNGLMLATRYFTTKLCTMGLPATMRILIINLLKP